MKRGGPLKRDPEKDREWRRRTAKPLKRSASLSRDASKNVSRTRRRRISPASEAQREKVRGAVSIVSGTGPCDPAHVYPRSLGGCDSPLCVVPLTREEHDAYDQGRLDLLPYLVKHRLLAELAHAIHHAGGLLQLLERVTNQRWQPVKETPQ